MTIIQEEDFEDTIQQNSLKMLKKSSLLDINQNSLKALCNKQSKESLNLNSISYNKDQGSGSKL